ncbi:Penicillin-binding protein 1A [alpha proteobacterium BAL199]|jgi:penicillin-binding protein 1A|nr:Penicillin-binding protein 1A [alpha proteobacterium BAL199]
MRWLLGLLATVFILAIAGVGAVLYGFYHFGRGLPDYDYLADYEPPVVTRVHAGDGRLLAEYARNVRVFVPIEAIPKRVIKAFLAAEDKNFYEHPGVDFVSLLSAIAINVKNYGAGRRPVGASTITQQVAKNFLLTNEVSVERKAKEAILAFRIERSLSKDRILELYLNEIYLGFGSYGVAAAALNYFDKPLSALTIGEAAYLAALPKAPNNYHPIRRHEAAVERRNYVISQMRRNGFISPAEGDAALGEPLVTRSTSASDVASADYFAEEVRRHLLRQYGEGALYEGGLSVRTSIDSRLQAMADKALRKGLEDYDRRHGWRGPVATVPVVAGWGDALAAIPPPKGLGTWRLALVLQSNDKDARIGFADGSLGSIPYAEVKWARAWLEDQRFGGQPKSVDEVLKPGDVIPVEPVAAGEDGEAYPEGSFALRQIPDVGGALVALDPHTGRVLAMSGGYDPQMSEFNRAVQAKRQPGSSFKPFVYLAALDSGYSPTTQILDAPFVIDQGAGLGKWKPSNYTNKFYGPTPMRIGIEQSRNLMTVRLAQTVGMEKVVEYAERFGVVEGMQPHLSYALGAGETTLLKITAAYGMLVNGGKRIEPSLIDRIVDRHGKTLWRHDMRPCEGCNPSSWNGGPPPAIPDTRAQLVDPASAYQIVSMLEGVVLRGTGRRIAELGRPLAGKTGTTNENFDTWFIGFSPNLAVGVFVGFDQPRTLGARDTGSSVAAPIFKDFMGEALDGKPIVDFRIPPGVRLVWIDHDTGVRTSPGARGAMLEAFKPGTEPGTVRTVLEGGVPSGDADAGSSAAAGPRPPVATGGSGLY